MAERYFGGWRSAPGAVTLDNNVQQLAAEPLPRPAAVAASAAGAAAAGVVAAIGVPAAAAATDTLRQLGAGSAAGSGVVWDRTAARSGSSREFRQHTAAGPLLAMGYYRPSVTGRRGTAMEVGGCAVAQDAAVSACGAGAW